MSTQTGDEINDGNWHFIVITYGGTSTTAGVNIFIDGVSKPLTVIENSLSSSILNDRPFTIGGRVSSFTLTGQVDDFRIFNQELTASEVEILSGL